MLHFPNPGMSAQPAVLAQAWLSDTTVLNDLGPELSDVVLAQCNKYQLTMAQAIALMFFKICVANQGARHIEDEGGNRIPLTLNCVLIGPAATGPILTQALSADLTAIEIETARDAIEKQAMFRAAVKLRLEKRRQIDAVLKVAARKMVRLQALLAQRRELEAGEPKAEDYPDHQIQLIAWNQRKEALQISVAQAKLEGEPDTAKALCKALNALLATPPSSFEADYRIWSLKLAAVESQIVLLHGADEEVAHLSAESQALLEEDARAVQSAKPKLGFLNVAVSSVHKAITTQWPVASALYSGASAIKALIRHGEAMTAAGSGRLLSPHAPGRVQLGIFAATTPEVFMRDVVAAGADGAVALANFLILGDLPQQDRGVPQKPSDPDCLAAFDAQVRAIGAASVRELLSDDRVPLPITVSPEAAAIVEAECSEWRNHRFARRQLLIMDAFLMMRVRQTFYVIAGLLHLLRGEVWPLSVRTMQDAITVGRFLIDQMARTVAMAREVPAEEIDAEVLFRALCGYVDQQMEKGEAKPFEIMLSALHSKAKNFGLTRARVNGALKVLVAWGWIKARQDGLDTAFDLDQHRFSSMNRPS
ncbi:DUF3987 domain-containing protein [Burkholderia pseudomallei]|uniref:DUF3987 domain-containing protein n=1 Tax=Burkholderia pseudomallei TaxID=28450 RepID=UPI000F08B3FE|nr:DUF3987 domain-containing protein [Burkholderia pseudomallei]MBF3650901.1 DUF3987 domain-containing protein [Burkholderia pseudomallei]MBF3668919.1 DUF3987 domain-containing protein [Burkholderia pseudomallei]MBF3774376.1 DUF3987 domain-containing protein [Burkholderia pseudomallei]MBF3873404.1 DUF3987 domain-containing protein [Burkholderia pseudomallei]MBF3907675.1 DUF3987 domain-containing protein [Burkholderia pseudomallei]